MTHTTTANPRTVRRVGRKDVHLVLTLQQKANSMALARHTSLLSSCMPSAPTKKPRLTSPMTLSSCSRARALQMVLMARLRLMQLHKCEDAAQLLLLTQQSRLLGTMPRNSMDSTSKPFPMPLHPRPLGMGPVH